MSGLRATALALLLASASCTLFTDTGGFTSTETDGGTEAGVISDAGGETAADAGGEAEAGSGAACPAGAKLCLDFDTDPFDQGLSHETNKTSSVVEPSTAHFVSPARGMRVAVADPLGIARLQFPVPTDATRTRLSFSIWIDPPSIGPTERISLGEILCLHASDDGGSHYAGAFLFLESSRLAVRGSTNVPLFDLPRKRFARVVFDLSWRATDADVEVIVDGVSFGKGTLTESCIGQQNWRVVMGISTGGISSLIEAYYDDVFFETL